MKERRASISRWLVGRLAIVAAAAAISVILVGSMLLYRFVSDVEVERIQERLARRSALLKANAHGLQVSATDYATWDHTVDFVHGLRPGYIDENFTADSMDNLDIDAALLAGDSGTPSLLARPRQPSGRERDAVFARLTMAAGQPRQDESPTVIWIDGRAMLIARAAIRRPTAPGTILGVLIFARFLDIGSVAVAGVESALDVRLVEMAATTADVGEVRIDGNIAVARTNLAGWPLAIEVREALVFQERLSILAKWLSLQVLINAGIAMLALYWLLRGKVTRRLDAFTARIRGGVASDSGLSHLPVSPSSDELDELAVAFNGLIDRIKEREDALHRLAIHDPLTGLGNRRRLMEQLTWLRQAQARWFSGCTLVVVNLDGFRHINEEAGFAVGDSVLGVVAHRVQKLVRGNDLAVRLGGDEFCILIENAPDPAHLSALCRSLLDGMGEGIEFDGNFYFVRASIGYCGTSDEGEIFHLLAHATAAMCRAKRAGGHCCRRYDAMLDRAAMDPAVGTGAE